MEDPMAWKCSYICTHNSLVGERTKAKYGYGLLNRLYRIGKANAKVLPDPVSANPIMSFF